MNIVSIQFKSQVLTHPRSSKIEPTLYPIPRPYDVSYETRQNVTWFSLF